MGVGEKHIDGYVNHPQCEVVVLCDFSEEKLAMARRKYPHLKLTSDADDVLEDPEVDIVSIASYDNYHYEQIVKALERDKHIFVEKPLCLYKEEARHIRSLLKEKPHLKIASNLILRMSPRFRLLKKIIKSGEMGQLFYIEGDYNYGRLHKITEGWRGEIDFYSVVYGGGLHIIDLMLWLTGDEVVEIAAYGTDISSRGSQFRYNDTVVCILRFESGMIGKVAANYACVFPHFHALSVYGTKATFVNGLEYGLLFESRNPEVPAKKILTAYPGTHKGELIYSFVDSIVTGAPEGISQKEVFQSMSVSFAIESAVQQSRSVMVDYI